MGFPEVGGPTESSRVWSSMQGPIIPTHLTASDGVNQLGAYPTPRPGVRVASLSEGATRRVSWPRVRSRARRADESRRVGWGYGRRRQRPTPVVWNRHPTSVGHTRDYHARRFRARSCTDWAVCRSDGSRRYRRLHAGHPTRGLPSRNPWGHLPCPHSGQRVTADHPAPDERASPTRRHSGGGVPRPRSRLRKRSPSRHCPSRRSRSCPW